MAACLSRSCYLNTLLHEVKGDYEPYFLERALQHERIKNFYERTMD